MVSSSPQPSSVVAAGSLGRIEAALLELLAAVRGSQAENSTPLAPVSAPSLVTVADVCNDFLVSKHQAGRSANYLKLSIAQLRAFAKGREGRPLATISAREISEWLHGQRWGGKTKRGHLMAVRNLFSWAVARGDISGNPAMGVDLPAAPERPPIVHTPAEVVAVLEAARGFDLTAMRCFAIRYFAGLRTSEAVALEETEINLAAGFIEVTAAKSKTRRRRLVPISTNLRAWLALGGTLPLPQVANRLRAVIVAAGVPWSPGVARHSFVSYHLARWRSASRTALEAGHTEAILFSTYRELVTPKAAKAYWAIVPTPLTVTAAS